MNLKIQLLILTALLISPLKAQAAEVTVVDARAKPGDQDIAVAIEVSGAKGVAGGDLVVSYDPGVLIAREVRGADLSASWLVGANLDEAGVIRISLAGGSGTTTSAGTFAEMRFDIRSDVPDGTTTSLHFQAVALNDENGSPIPVTATHDGSLVIRSTAVVESPVPSFTASVSTGTAPLTAQFTNTSTGSDNSYAWDFGDSGTSTTVNPSHTFTKAGVYTVTLTATNAGGTNSATYTITVTAPVAAPVTAFTASVTGGAAPLTVRFTNTSTGSGNTYTWSFGDGGTGTTANISHTFTTAGTYTVRLTATNAGGTQSTTRTITVTTPVTRLLARAIVGNSRVKSPQTVEAGTTLRFEVSTFTKADTSDLKPVTDFTWTVPSRLGKATTLGQMSVATVAGVSDSITFQRQNARASFRLTIGPSAVSKISITPANAAVKLGQQKQFSAQGLDRYNNKVSSQTFNWHVVGNIGTIDRRTGMFTAGRTAGSGFIIAGAIVNGTIVFGDNSASASGTARVVVSSPIPEQISLHQNTPNPFNPSTEIIFDLPDDGRVRLTIYNLVGQEVEQLVDQPFPAGTHIVRWDASGQPTGTYIYVLESGTYRVQRKMLLLR